MCNAGAPVLLCMAFGHGLQQEAVVIHHDHFCIFNSLYALGMLQQDLRHVPAVCEA